MYHIKTKIPMLLDYGKEQIINYSHESIDVESLDIGIKCYPLKDTYNGKQVIPSYVFLSNENIVNTDKYYVVKYPNNHTDIVILPFCIDNTKIIDRNTIDIVGSSQKIELVTSTTSTIIISSQNKKSHYELFQKCNILESIYSQDIINIILEEQETKVVSYLQIADSNVKLYKDVTLEKTDNYLTILCPLNDMAKQAIFVQLTKKPKVSFEQKLVYIDNNPKLITDPKLIPYAFLEALKVKNLKLARNYLDNKINSHLNDSSLLSFFGEYIEITFDKYNDKLCLIYKEENTFNAKCFDFDITGNKISNINEL